MAWYDTIADIGTLGTYGLVTGAEGTAANAVGFDGGLMGVLGGPEAVNPNAVDPLTDARRASMEQNYGYGGGDPIATAMGSSARDTGNWYADQASQVAGAHASNISGAGAQYAAPMTGVGDVAAGRGGVADARTQQFLAQDRARNMAVGVYGAGMRSAADQNRIGSAFEQMAYGPAGPSVAEAQLTRGTADANAAASSLAGSGRGFGGSASALRQAQNVQASNLGGMNADLSVLRAQEAAADRQFRAGALGNAANTFGSAANTALGAGGYYTGALQGAENTSVQGALGFGNQGLGYTNAATGAYAGAANTGMAGATGAAQVATQGAANSAQIAQTGVGQQHDAMVAGQQGGAAFEGNLAGRRGQDLGVVTGNMQAENAHDAAIIGAVGTGVGMAAGRSDIRAKTDIVPVSPMGGELASLRAPLAPRRAPGGSPALEAAAQTPLYSYRYKEPREPREQGGQLGIMAQDLAKTPLGREAVSIGPDGQGRVDTGKAALISLGAANDLNAKLDALLAKSRGSKPLETRAE